MMTKRMGLVGIRIIAQMMGYLILMREGTIFLGGYNSKSDSEAELPLPPDLSTTQSTALK